ncbi:MAG TPA: hypothetical protein PKJ62_00745 [Bacteroidia bacterium]|nr:hypothetical protein [Bacteroidia bacterium]HNS12680.1 hypothetical protein [Bacteroidia bacterium]
MKKRKIALISAILLSGLMTLNYGCKKDDEVKEFDTQSSQDNSLAEATFNDIMEITNQAIENGSSGLSTFRKVNTQGTFMSTCATLDITPDSSGQGGSIVIDFGPYSCLCDDGRYRKGVIHVTYTATYRDSGAIITMNPQSYFVGRDTTNMYQVYGTKTLINKGHNAAGHLWYTIDVNGEIHDRNHAVMSWTSQRTREWLAGESTMGTGGYVDDVYSITGTSSGTTFEGKSYTANITKALVFKLDPACRHIVEGIFELTPSGLPTRTLDYGNGTCDNDATITVNGATFNIKLR